MENKVKIWVDETYPIITIKFLKASIDTFSLQEIFERHTEIIREASKDGKLYTCLICDTANLNTMSLDLTLGYFIHEFPKFQRAGLGFQIFVKPKGNDAHNCVEAMIKEIGFLPIITFDSYAESMNYAKEEIKKACLSTS